MELFSLFTSSSLKRSNPQLLPRICPLHAYLHKYQAPEVCTPSHTMPVSKSTKAVGAEIFFHWELSVATCLSTRDPWMPRSDYCLVVPPALALIDVATVSVIRAVLLVGANDDTVLGYKEDAVLGLRVVSWALDVQGTVGEGTARGAVAIQISGRLLLTPTLD